MPPRAEGDDAGAQGRPARDYDYIVIGGGIAGCQLAYEFEKTDSSYLVIERNHVPGSFFHKFPRHRELISTNKRFNLFEEKEFNMRHDWNSLLCDDDDLLFKNYSTKLFPPADALCRYVNDFCQRYQLKIQYGTHIKKISREEKIDGKWRSKFTIVDHRGLKYTCKALIVATGAVKDMLPKVPGIELCENYSDHDLDLTKYENKNVCIIGGGNSAFETANHLAETAANIHFVLRSPLKFAWDTHFVGNVRAVNNTVLDMYHLKSMHALRNIHPTRIWKDEETGKMNMEHDLHLPHWETPGTGSFATVGVYDHIIVATGWKYLDTDIHDETTMPETHRDGKFPTLSNQWESSVPDMFYAGTSMQSIDKRVASGFIHGFRYLCRTLYNILKFRYEEVPLPRHVVPKINIEDFITYLIKRVSTTSALYQMGQSFLVDLMVFDVKSKDSEDKNEYEGTVDHILEVPSKWVIEQDLFKKAPHVWMVGLEDQHDRFEEMQVSEFFIPPDMNQTQQPCSAFVRPVIRVFEYGKLKTTFEMNGSIIVRTDVHIYHEDQTPQRYRNKLKNFIHKHLGIGTDGHFERLFTPELWEKKFRPWTQEEIEEYKKNEQMKVQMKPKPTCSFKPNF